MDKSLVKVSKFLSLVLRHQPELIGLQLDAHGWADVEELLDKAQRHQRALDRATLERVVRENEKQRFAFNEDETKIRANQGHSIQVDLQLEPTEPLPLLFHGTATRFLAAIAKSGLNPQSRQHVHLSPDETTAILVGQRHGTSVVLKIRAAEMAAAGYQFYLSQNGVWLTESVPVEYIEFPPELR